MQVNNKLDKCIDYFKEEKGFQRLLQLMKSKYESLGHVGGNIVLKQLTKEEKEALSGLMGKDYSTNKTATISLKKFEESLGETVFKGITLKDLLEGYYNATIIYNKEKKRVEEIEKEQFFKELYSTLEDDSFIRWLELQKEIGTKVYQIFVKRYNNNKEELKHLIQNLDQVILHLPYKNNSIEQIAVFATKYLRNPHALDEGKDILQMLYYYLSNKFSLNIPRDGEEKNELLYKAGLLRDPLSNYTICKGLLGYNNGQVHKGWQGFFKRNEPLNISLWNIREVKNIKSITDKVYIIENPTVMGALINKYKDNFSCICTNGQIKLSTYLLLDKLALNYTKMYYAGDFDPEGLLIAYKLKKRYGEVFNYWGYTVDNYLLSISNQRINDRRLKQLKHIEDIQLTPIINELNEKRKAGYQEALINEYFRELKHEI
ncbi:MAG: TIGR02679 family protein [Eubacteriales bacterium]